MGIGGSKTHIKIVSDYRSPGTLRNGLSFFHALAEAVPLPGISVHILVEKARQLRDQGESNSAIGRLLGVSHQTISSLYEVAVGGR
jgi:Helix-turn-helix domain